MLEDLHGKDEKKWPAERSDFCSSRRCEGVQVRLQTNEERRELLHSKVEDYKKERLRKHVAKDRWKVRPPPPSTFPPTARPTVCPLLRDITRPDACPTARTLPWLPPAPPERVSRSARAALEVGAEVQASWRR